MLRKTVAILVLFLSFIATEAFALGLGRVSVESSLNQPLRVRIEVLQLGDTRLEDVVIQLASPEDFQRFNIERASFLNNIRFTTEATNQGDFVILTTSQIVREPYLSFILETRWSNGRLLSEHTILLDLPVYEEQAVPTAPVRRPISATVNSPATGQAPSQPEITPPSSTPATTNAPSVQPVLEPEVIAPTADDAASPEPQSQLLTEDTAEEVELDQEATEDSALQNNDEEAADDAGAEELLEQSALPQEDSSDQSETDQLADAAESEAEPAEDQIENELLEATEEAADPAVERDADQQPESVTVGAADTLSNIALQVRPNTNVSIQQTMLAIQELNPDAFAGGNINRLRRGEVLRIPTLEDIQAIGQRDAIAEVSRQNQQNAVVDVQPLAAPSQTVAEPADSSGQLSVVTADPDADSTDGSGVTENSNTDVLDQRIAELEEQLALQEEEADRARIEKEELESRLAELEEQIAAAQEIIRLQDLQLAQLQQSLADAAADAAEAADANRIAEEQAEMAAAVEPAPVAAQAQSNESFIDSLLRSIMSNSLLLAGAVAALVLLLVGVLVMRNRANREDEERLDVISDDEFKGVTDTLESEQSERDDESFDDVSEFEDYNESELDSELDAFISAGGESAENRDELVLDNEQSVADQIDLLIEHQQFEQAESLTDEAMASNPDDLHLQMKRLEILAALGNLSSFEEQAESTESLVEDDEKSKIATLRAGLTSAELDAASPAPTITEIDSQRQKDDTASFLDDLGIDLDSFEDDAFHLSDEEPNNEEPNSAESHDEEQGVESGLSEVQSPLEEVEADTGDVTFDLDSTAEVEVTEGIVDEEEKNSDSDDSIEIEPLLADSSGEEVEGAFSQGDSKELDDLDIDTLEFDVEAPEPDTSDSSAKDENEEELELETFTFESPEIEAGEEAEDSDEQASEEDDNLLDFDFDKSELATEKPSEEIADVEAFDFDLEGDSADTVVEKSSTTEAELDLGVDTETPSNVELAEDEFDFDLSELEIDGDDDADNNIEIELSDDDFLDLDEELLMDESSDEPAGKEADDAIEFDFDEPLSAATAAAETQDTVLETTTDSPTSDDDLDFLADEDVVIEMPDHEGDPESLSAEEETATKLELAYAYQKMGDADGAKEILQEVIAEGSESQVKEAQDLISAIDSNPE
ncbi:MAG: FimV/HubP family polar landmark protein [Pseudohongiellaceae bacterium]